MEKFDLMNTRLDPAICSHRVYDSTEDYKAAAYVPKQANLAEVSFLSKEERIYSPPKGEGTNTLDFTVMDRFGFYHEVHRKNDNKMLLKFSTTAEHAKEPPRKRINTPIMNAVLDNIHDVQPETISRRLKRGDVKGGLISSTKKSDGLYIATKLGPGEYDIPSNNLNETNYLKFSSVARNCDLGVNASPKQSKRNKYFSGYLKSSDDESLSSQESDSKPRQRQTRLSPPRPLTPPKAATIKFSQCDRWKDFRNRPEAYVKTTGLILSPDFDKHRDKRIYMSMDNAMARGNGLDGVSNLTASVDIDVNCGNKTTLVKSLELSPVKYSAPFK